MMLSHTQRLLTGAVLTATMASPAFAVGPVGTSKISEKTVEHSFTSARTDTAAPVIVELFRAKGMSTDINVRLKEETDRAIALGRTPVLELSASRCGICRLLDASLQHPRMRDILRDIYVIRVDIDVWKAQLGVAGYKDLPDIPVIVALGANGRPTGQMWSGATLEVNGDPATMQPQDDTKYLEQVATALQKFLSTCQREFFRTMIS